MQLFICVCMCARAFFSAMIKLRRSAIQIRKLSFIFISNDVCSAMSFPVFCVLVIDSFRFQFCLPLAIVKYPIVMKVKAVLLIKLHVQRCLTREHSIALFYRVAGARTRNTNKHTRLSFCLTISPPFILWLMDVSIHFACNARYTALIKTHTHFDSKA